MHSQPAQQSLFAAAMLRRDSFFSLLADCNYLLRGGPVAVTHITTLCVPAFSQTAASEGAPDPRSGRLPKAVWCGILSIHTDTAPGVPIVSSGRQWRIADILRTSVGNARHRQRAAGCKRLTGVSSLIKQPARSHSSCDSHFRAGFFSDNLRFAPRRTSPRAGCFSGCRS